MQICRIEAFDDGIRQLRENGLFAQWVEDALQGEHRNPGDKTDYLKSPPINFMPGFFSSTVVGKDREEATCAFPAVKRRDL